MSKIKYVTELSDTIMACVKIVTVKICKKVKCKKKSGIPAWEARLQQTLEYVTSEFSRPVESTGRDYDEPIRERVENSITSEIKGMEPRVWESGESQSGEGEMGEKS